MHNLKWWQHVISQSILGIVAVFAVLPIWSMARIAFDGSIHGAPTEFRLWPAEPALAVFSHVWSKPSQSLIIPGLLKNSLVVSGGQHYFPLYLVSAWLMHLLDFAFQDVKQGYLLYS
jgi:ABC-type glycerol-3-phosphate transport system permease component